MKPWIESILNLTVPLSEADWTFRLVQTVEYPLLVCWMGNLKVTPSARHLVACVKLTGLQVGRAFRPNLFVPDKFAPEATHDFFAIYQKIGFWKHTITLFRFQAQMNDETAEKLTQTLANAMINCSSSSAQYLLDERYHTFWQDITKIKLEQMTPQSSQIWTSKRQ